MKDKTLQLAPAELCPNNATFYKVILSPLMMNCFDWNNTRQYIAETGIDWTFHTKANGKNVFRK